MLTPVFFNLIKLSMFPHVFRTVEIATENASSITTTETLPDLLISPITKIYPTITPIPHQIMNQNNHA